MENGKFSNLEKEKHPSLNERLRDIDLRRKELIQKIKDIKQQEEVLNPVEIKVEEERIEKMVEKIEEKIEEKNQKEIIREIIKIEEKKPKLRTKIGGFLKNIYEATTKRKLRAALYLTAIPSTIGIGAYYAAKTETGQEYYKAAKELKVKYWDRFGIEEIQNYRERHSERVEQDDPKIQGIDDLYSENVDTQKTTYDFLGKEKIPYKSGYYRVSVFDLTDSTPPKFKILKEDENYSTISNTAGITTNLFNPFEEISEIRKRLTTPQDNKLDYVRVIAYNKNNGTIKAGKLNDFDENWLVSQTWIVKMDFQKDANGNIELEYAPGIFRMAPKTTNKLPNGEYELLQIGITRNKEITKINPYEATNFGILEGGKVLMVSGEKQLQVNGSFADIYKVYEKLKKDQPKEDVIVYRLDNGSYSLPIWSNTGEVTTKMIRDHMKRNNEGGTALVLVNDGAISPYEYKNKYKEIQHIIQRRLDENTGQPIINEHSVIVLHHTGEYKNPQEIINTFENPENEKSAHVVIFKDGTRHIFDDDNAVLDHAGKSIFNNREKVNLFSIGIEMEGDSENGKQFTIAQLESLIEFLRPRIEKYNIPFENITDHETIRNNWFLAHPDRKDEKGNTVQGKRDLDDEVFKQIQELIKKKIYNAKKIVPYVSKNENGSNLLGALLYQEGFRTTKNKEYSLTISKNVLKKSGFSEKDADRVKNWVENFS